MGVSGLLIDCVGDVTTRQPFWVILCRREREKSDRRDSRGDKREGRVCVGVVGWKKNRNESKEKEEIKASPLYPYLLQG